MTQVAVDFHVVSGTGPKALTVSCGGEVPAGYILEVSRNSAYGGSPNGAPNGYSIALGAFDGTTNIHSSTCVANNTGTTSGRVRVGDDNLIYLYNASSQESDPVLISAGALAADTININVTANTQGDLLVRTYTFYGAGAQCKAWSVDTASRPTVLTHNFGTSNYHLYFAVGAFRGSGHNSSQNRPNFVTGYGVWDGASTITQSGHGQFQHGGQSTSITKEWMRDDVFMVNRTSSNGASETQYVITAADQNSFTFDYTLNRNQPCCFFAVDCGDRKAWTGLLTTPASTTTWNVTGVGFKPGLVGVTPSNRNSAGDGITAADGPDATGWGMANATQSACIAGYTMAERGTTSTATYVYDDSFAVAEIDTGRLLKA